MVPENPVEFTPRNNNLSLSLNHLLTIAELRTANRGERFFDNNLLLQLRNGVTRFFTAGKVTAQHLPLPRPSLMKDKYQYIIGENSYPSRQIKLGFHASPAFLNQNTNFLPKSDFRDFLYTTTIDPRKKSIKVSKEPITSINLPILFFSQLRSSA